MFVYMFRRTKRKARRDKLTLYYYDDYSRLAFVVVANTIMMTGRLVCSVYVCVRVCVCVCIDQNCSVTTEGEEEDEEANVSLSLSFLRFTTREGERERKPVYGQIFFSLLRRKKPTAGRVRERVQGESDLATIRRVCTLFRQKREVDWFFRNSVFLSSLGVIMTT